MSGHRTSIASGLGHEERPTAHGNRPLAAAVRALLKSKRGQPSVTPGRPARQPPAAIGPAHCGKRALESSCGLLSSVARSVASVAAAIILPASEVTMRAFVGHRLTLTSKPTGKGERYETDHRASERGRPCP